MTMRALVLIAAVVVMASMPIVADTSSAYTQTVNKAVPGISVSASGTSFAIDERGTFTALLAGTGPQLPTGTVTFKIIEQTNAGAPLTSAPVTIDNRGYANWTTGFPAQGAFHLSATFAGDLNYQATTSETLPFDVTGLRDFSFAFTPATITVKQGESLASKLVVTSINGFTGTVQLECASPDSLITCGLAKSQVVLAAAPGANAGAQVIDPTNTDLLITTYATTVKTLSAGLLLFGFPLVASRRFRRRQAALLVLCLALASTLVMSGCGSSLRYEQNNGTRPGNYQVTVTGTSGTLKHSVNLNVIVVKK